MSTDTEAAAAKHALQTAISAYYAAVQPDAYIDGWVLATHKLTPELEQADTSAVGVLAATSQSFVITRGLLHVALESERVT